MITTAVILAAGMGTRLGDLGKDIPKGFLVIDDISLIEASVLKLIEAGIEKIVIGTGHLSNMYKELAQRYSQIECVFNPKYRTSGSMQTLLNLESKIDGDFLLLESDLIYEKAALQILTHHQYKNVILATESEAIDDEVFIEVSQTGTLTKMTKDRDILVKPNGVLVGISRLQKSTLDHMCEFAKQELLTNPLLCYEDVLVELSSSEKLYVNLCTDLIWCEIDTAEHWQRANRKIYPRIKQKEGLKPVKRNILLNPGPATTTDFVKYAQVIPDLCHREREFGDTLDYISSELTTLAGPCSDYATVLFGGSGTAAVESMISSVIGNGVLLIVNNGFYGQRMCDMAKVYGLNYVEFNSSADHAVDLKALENQILNWPQRITHLAAVHNETSTGLLIDINSLGKLCSKYNIVFMVDAMSSFGAIPISMMDDNVSFLAASSNKNLQGMPGISFVIAQRKALETLVEIKAKSYYLDLYAQAESLEEKKQMRFTPPVQTLFALRQAILELKDEGIQNRYQRYSEVWEILIQGITGLRLKHLVKREDHSKIVTAILKPDLQKYDFSAMHDYFYSRGITIYPGQLSYVNTFRVANIGAINTKDMQIFVSNLEQYLRSIGYRLN